MGNACTSRTPASYTDPLHGKIVNWWAESGGRSLSFGSDAHEPAHLARGFALAAQVAEAAGFRPGDSHDFWRRS